MKAKVFLFLMLFFMKTGYGEISLDAVEKVMNSTVCVTTKRVDSWGGIFDYIWPGVPQYGIGSGFITELDGNAAYVVTCAHVVYGLSRGETVFVIKRSPSFKIYQASFVGRDSKSDVAVLKIEREVDESFSCLSWADSSKVKVGQSVFLVGSPFDSFLVNSLTAGMISNVERNGENTRDMYDKHTPEGFIQFDASANSGNSGGPLCDEQGNVVGMAAWIIPHWLGVEGIAFAVPSYTIEQVCRQLISFGKVLHGFLGIEIDLTRETAFGLFCFEKDQGAFIQKVIAGSPAALEGLKVGDRIVEINGHFIRSGFSARNYLYPLEPGQQVHLVIDRFGERLEKSIRLGSEEMTKKFSKSLQDGVAF